ncbi:MAG: phage tail protein [Planctomycetes bacterium]|nr:phage tail protein [Planctomycetota bacterium]
MDPFVAEVRMFPFNFAPKGWAFCDGQLLPISQNTALFSLLGTTYGGDGKSTFGLPNIQGNAVMHPGQGPGLSLHDLGETGGSETVTLLQSEMPSHNHTPMGVAAGGNQTNPTGQAVAQGGNRSSLTYKDNPGTTGPFQQLGLTGGNQPHNNMQPYLTLNFCLALQGVYPPRS